MILFKGRLRWALVFWIFVLSATAYLDRVNISIAGQFLQKELGLDNTQLGWVFSAFVLGYALFQAPAGRLADRFGPRKSLTWATIWWGIFSVLTAVVSSSMAYALALLIGIRFLLGVGEAIMYPSSNRFVSRWIPIKERGKANGVIFAGVGAGAGVAPPLITYIMTQYGWRVSFVISAFIGVTVGLIWYFLSRDQPGQHAGVDKEEAAYIHAGLPTEGYSGANRRLSWGTIFGSRNVWLLIFSYASFGYTAYIFFTWFFIYLNQVRGLDLKASALYSILPFLSMAAGSIIGGWASDRLTKKYGRWTGRCLVGTVAMALSASLVALATQVADARVASVVLAGGAFGIYLAQSSFWSVSADIGTRSAGSLSGVMNMGNQLAGALTASLTPWIGAHFGWSASFQVAAAFCAAGAAAWLMVNPEIELGSPTVDAQHAGTGAPAVAR